MHNKTGYFSNSLKHCHNHLLSKRKYSFLNKRVFDYFYIIALNKFCCILRVSLATYLNTEAAYTILSSFLGTKVYAKIIYLFNSVTEQQLI